MSLKSFLNFAKDGLKSKAKTTILDPLNQMTDDTLRDISTTIGSFAIRSIRGKFQRSISFSVNSANYRNYWMEDALYSILYKYNDLRKSNKLELINSKEIGNSKGIYYRLEPGFHNLKYRNFNILLIITNESSSMKTVGGRVSRNYTYTIITYNLDPKFVTYFEQDMLERRNSMFELSKDSKTISVWSEEDDDSKYLMKYADIPKRKLDTIYLPKDVKDKLVNTINTFIASKQLYADHGIPWNLKILLHGLPGTGKSSIEKVIASEWNRTLVYLKGSMGGKTIPHFITSIGTEEELTNPLIVIADIDKYPALIDDTKIDNNDKEKIDEKKSENKLLFGRMINALDGVTSGENKIIIMDTNHIDKFSPVFLRPGRIDLILEIPTVQPEVFRKYIFDHFQKELPEDIKMKGKNVTIPEIQFDVLFSKMSFEEICKKYLK